MDQNIIQEMLDDYGPDSLGWNFSHLTKRMEESIVPWDYQQIVEEYISEKEALLDLGTGGGEFLTSLKNLPHAVYTTEGYKPNFPIAEKRLTSIGASVKFISVDKKIPYSPNRFDIVIN